MFANIAKELYGLNVFSDPESSWPFPTGMASDLIAKNMPEEVTKYILSKNHFSFFEGYDLFLILLNRDFKNQQKQEALKKMYNFVLTDLKEIRKVPKEICKYTAEYGAIIFLLNSLSEIELPVYRRCFSTLCVDSDYIMREYQLSIGKVKIIAKVDQSPKLGYFMHTLDPEKVQKYNLYLSDKDISPELLKKKIVTSILKKQNIRSKNIKEIQLYFINQFRKYLGLRPVRKLKFYLNKEDYFFSDEKKQYVLNNKQKFLDSTERIIREMVGE